MKRTLSIILISLFCSFTEGGLKAQNRFKASVMVGLNLAQIHGDNQDGYSKKGASLGLMGSMVVTPDFDICTELLYNERGTVQSATSQYRFNKLYTAIDLKYSEMSLLLRYYFQPRIAENYYKQSIRVGASYGRLLKSQTTILQNQKFLTPLAETMNQAFNRNDFSLIIMWSYFLSPRLSVGVRHTNSLNFLYKQNLDVSPYENMSPYFLSFQLTYDFIAAKGIKVVSRKLKKNKLDPLEELY